MLLIGRLLLIYIGEVLAYEEETGNEHDRYVVKNEGGETEGHVPIDMYKVFNASLADYDGIKAESIGNRYNRGWGKGLKI